MCGIAGWISNKPLDKETSKLLSEALLFYASERGAQSAGIWTPDNGLLKKAVHPKQFVKSHNFMTYWKHESKICLLHTRQPTCGARGDAQAQPFDHGDTVTVHNGWYHNAKPLRDQWKLNKTSGVDSELACEFIEAYGIKKLPEFIESGYGSSALGIYNNGKLFVYRDGNPLSIVHLSFDGGLKLAIFASTSELLESALKYLWLMPLVQYRSIKEHKLYELTPSGLIGIIGHAKRMRGSSNNLWLENDLPDEPKELPGEDSIRAFFRANREDFN